MNSESEDKYPTTTIPHGLRAAYNTVEYMKTYAWKIKNELSIYITELIVTVRYQ